jgi:non-specific protein-tyrosine kinase
VELRRYFLVLRKWFWLVILTVALSAGSAYVFSINQPALYQSSTTIMVGQFVNQANPNGGDLGIAYWLAQSYVLVVKQEPVLQATINALKLDMDWGSLARKVSANVIGQTQLFQVSVTDTDPKRAKLITDEVAHQLILSSPTSSQEFAAQKDFAKVQLDDLKLRIEQANKDIAALNTSLSIETDAEKAKVLQGRIDTLEGKKTAWQTSYGQYLNALNGTGVTNVLTVVQPAVEPSSPFSPNVTQNLLFAVLGGIILAIAAILLLEYLDDTVKNGEDLERLAGVPSLGFVPLMASIKTQFDTLVTARQPRSPIAEAYRVVRTNLQFSGIENPGGAFVITSAAPGEGKSTTAVNLAVALAQAGKRVVLVDADLRRPSIHKFFQMTNDRGLSSLLLPEGPSLEFAIRPSGIEGLNILTSGVIPPNPSELLAGHKMEELIERLRATNDMIIFDSPPVLAVADTVILAKRVAGAVFVVEGGHTRSEVFRRATESMRQVGAKILGAVINKVDSRRTSYYYDGYYAYSRYYRSGAGPKS